VAGIGLTGDCGGEDDARFLLQANEGLAPGGLIGAGVAAGDRDEPAAFGEAGQGRRNVAHGSFGKAPVDMRRGREGRVHQHHARPDRRIEPVVDLLRVVAADLDPTEQAAEQRGARVGDLVKRQPRFRELGEDRQQARAGRRLEDEVCRRQCCRLGGGEAERYRRRELLELF
jgi:hypothetical protein